MGGHRPWLRAMGLASSYPSMGLPLTDGGLVPRCRCCICNREPAQSTSTSIGGSSKVSRLSRQRYQFDLPHLRGWEAPAVVSNGLKPVDFGYQNWLKTLQHRGSVSALGLGSSGHGEWGKHGHCPQEEKQEGQESSGHTSHPALQQFR